MNNAEFILVLLIIVLFFIQTIVNLLLPNPVECSPSSLHIISKSNRRKLHIFFSVYLKTYIYLKSICQIQPGYVFFVFASFMQEETIHLCNYLRIESKWLCKPSSKPSKFVVFYCKTMIEHLENFYSVTFCTIKARICIWSLSGNFAC